MVNLRSAWELHEACGHCAPGDGPEHALPGDRPRWPRDRAVEAEKARARNLRRFARPVRA